MAEDIDRFIQEQKSKLARERKEMQQESAQKVLEPASTNNLGAATNGFKENIPPSDKGVALETSKALPVGSHDNLRNKLAKERQEEYQQFLAEKEKRSGPRSQPPPQAPIDGASLNIPSRDSAKERTRIARNKEYNDFLKNKGSSTTHKPRVGNAELLPGITQRGTSINPITGEAVAVAKPSPRSQPNNHPPDPRLAAPPQDRFQDLQTRREAASQTPRPILRDYDDRPPPGPPGGPRRGWGTPQPDYDEILRRKREEEARYRRYDEDLDYYPPRGGIRPSHSDPHLNRYPPEDGRYSRARYDYYDPEYDRRRVRFSDERSPNERGYPPPGNVRYDRPPADRPPVDRPPPGRPPGDVLNEPFGYDWNLRRNGRSRTQPELERQRSNVGRAEDNTDGQPPRAKSATLSNEEVGIGIGNRDTASATRRKKEQYRKELEQQMREAQEAKKREKQQGLRINASSANDPAKKGQGATGYASTRGNSRTPVPSQQPPPQQPVGNQPAGYQPAGYQPAGYQPSFQASGQPQVPALGLEEAIARSRLGEAPLVERPFSLNSYQPTFNANSTDPYMYYGVRNPLDPDPGAISGKDGDTFAAQGIANRAKFETVNDMKSAYKTDFAYRTIQPPVSLNATYPSTYDGLPGVGKGVPLNNAPQENLALLNASKTAQIRGESSIKNFVGDTTLSPRSLNDPKSYQAILKQQMFEKERKKRIEKEEQERYDAKLEAQAAEYNPWGKGGGGAPMRDNKGKIVADLRQLHKHNEDALNNPASTQLQLYADQPLAPNTTTAAVTADRSPRPGAAEPLPATTAPKDSKDEYKEYLKQQVEEKKKREAALKEKIRLEEEREEKRLEQQRIQMQKDFELEQKRVKAKEEEKQRQAQELERKIKEQKEEAEKEKQDAREARRRKGEQDKRKQEQAQIEQKERYSPPIPALRKKESPARQSSPPIPALRKKKDKEEEKKDSPRKVDEVHGTPRKAPGSQREMDARPIKPAKADIYNRPYSKEFGLVDWLRSIDPDLVVYAPALAENGYKTEKTVRRMSRHTLLQFCPDMKHGHVEALLHEVERIQTPASKKEARLIDLLSYHDSSSDDDRIEPGPVKQNWQEQEGASKDGVDGAGRDPRDVMIALSAMRRQLHSEQRRIQSQLDRNKEHEPYSGPKLSSRSRASPQVDVFEVARHKAPVAVRREPLTHHAAAAEFSSLKNRETNSRHRLRNQFPDHPSSDLTLEAQQRVLLRHQQEKLENLRRAKSKRPLEEQMPSMAPRDLGRTDSPLLALESESAFIGINNGIADIPNTPPHRKKPPSPRRDYSEPTTSVAKPKDPLGSTMSFDNDTIDYLAQKNKDRNKALKQLEDNTSLVDPDDVLQRFMMRDSHDRPKSAKSEDLSLWLQPTVGDY